MTRQQSWQAKMRASHHCIQCGERCRRLGAKHDGRFPVRCDVCRAKRREAVSYKRKLRDQLPQQVLANDQRWIADEFRRVAAAAIKEILERRPSGPKGITTATHAGTK